MPPSARGHKPDILARPAMSFTESGFTFPCGHESLLGVISAPEQPAERGILIVVGGPQYRVGSHRQFTLLARALAGAGIPAMRFDYRGMGDSEGDPRNFEEVNDDMLAAVDAFFERCPSLGEVVLWGLCDAASAILFYARKDPRVCGIVLANPWVRTAEGLARAHLRHYYVRRLLEPALWRKIRSGQFRVGASVVGVVNALLRVLGRRKGRREDLGSDTPLPERMREGLAGFSGHVLLILSGNDLTAREFEDTVHASSKWQALLDRKSVVRRSLPEADHTFSRREWRDRVAAWTEQWVRSW